MEPGRVFLTVSFYRKEIFMNEIVGLRVSIRFGIQPSACFSSRGRAEIQQNGTGFLLGRGQGLIDIFAPIHAHIGLLET
jgi:hypothetical protein